MQREAQTRVIWWPGGADAAWEAAAPPRGVFRVDLEDGACRSRWVDPESGADLPAPVAFVHEPLADLDAVLAWGRAQGDASSGWVGVFSYDLGRVIEPAVEGHRFAPARPGATRDREWPLIELHRVQERRAWTATGEAARLGEIEIESGERYRAGVRAALDYIRSGHIFQANLAHRMTANFSGDPLGAFARLVESARPRHGAYLRLAPAGGLERAVLSASPEMFFRIDAEEVHRQEGRCHSERRWRVTTRPMKGTRPATVNVRELMDSPKDRAELDMIIDLMRNDLGHISELRSVRVDARREIELHGAPDRGLWQATATVSGLVRDGITFGGILNAVFPAGSVTGAPKIRAMQIIDELEAVRRGPYCGSIGWIGDDGSALMNVAIRTALISGVPDGRGRIEGALDYSVGAGIVAESDPAAEWEETIAKAGVLGTLAGAVEVSLGRGRESTTYKAQSTHF